MQIKHLKNIKALVLDMDGVLWRERDPIGDLPAVFERIRKSGLKFLMATNNGTRTPRQYVEKLAGLGVSVTPDQIITSALGAAFLLQKNLPNGSKVFVIGEDGVIQALEKAGFILSSEDANAVVVGMDRGITFDKLKTACLLIRRGVPFFATNPDRTFPTPEGLIPGAGALVAALEACTDVHPTIIGKPNPYLFEMAIQRLGLSPEEVLVVGDRLETDILGGARAGCRTALVLSGISTKEEASTFEVKPDLIAPALDDLLKEV